MSDIKKILFIATAVVVGNYAYNKILSKLV